MHIPTYFFFIKELTQGSHYFPHFNYVAVIHVIGKNLYPMLQSFSSEVRKSVSLEKVFPDVYIERLSLALYFTRPICLILLFLSLFCLLGVIGNVIFEECCHTDLYGKKLLLFA